MPIDRAVQGQAPRAGAEITIRHGNQPVARLVPVPRTGDRVFGSDAGVFEVPEDLDYLSAANTWEIAIKHRLGKLPLPELPTSYVPERMTRSGTEPLPVEIHHTLAAGQLPLHHWDPFDRLLVTQSRILGLPLVTADDHLGAYDVDLRWE